VCSSDLYCLLRRFNNRFTIQVDDREPISGEFLFALGGNSRWYGGGYKGCPRALPDDGLLDCITVRRAFGRLKLISLIGKYKRGEHLGWLCTDFVRGKKMHIHSDVPAAVNVDGECHYVKDSVFELKEKAVCYVVPQGSAYLERRKSGTLDETSAG
jgi:diacylglycerol kinase family enzyme